MHPEVPISFSYRLGQIIIYTAVSGSLLHYTTNLILPSLGRYPFSSPWWSGANESTVPCAQVHNMRNMIFLALCRFRSEDLPHHKRALYHWATVPLTPKSFIQDLTGGNWQKWKRLFLTCPCHKIYRDEAVGLKSCKNTWKITIFVKMWNLGQYRENLIFCQ